MFGVQSFGNGINKEFREQTETNITDLTNLLQAYTIKTSIYSIAKFDISTFIDDSQVRLRGNFNYSVSLYTETTINEFIKTYTQILKQIAKCACNRYNQEQIKIESLSYLDTEQHKQIIHSWNQTDKTYPDNKTIHQLFEEQVEKNPDSIALVYEERKLSYRELNKRANQLANYLRHNHNIIPDTLIVLCLDRSEHMLIAILAALKAGGAYVPIDPNYPEESIYCKILILKWY
jgi:non-ribosomal peptide synthetase component F